jgi:transcription termination factor Rho
MMAILGNDEKNNGTEGVERIIERLRKTKNNKEFLDSITQPEKK